MNHEAGIFLQIDYQCFSRMLRNTSVRTNVVEQNIQKNLQ